MPFKKHPKNFEKTSLFNLHLTFIIELTSLIKTSSQTVILMNIIYIALKTSFKKQHFFKLTSLLKMDLTFIIKFAQKLTSLIKMDLTSLFKTSFKKQPSGTPPAKKSHQDGFWVNFWWRTGTLQQEMEIDML